MRRAPSIIPILALVAVTSILSLSKGFAQRVIVDPNAGRPNTSVKPARAERYDPAKDPDKRMAQKVSYEALHARLSVVAAGISESSGVSIVCGRGSKDWQVRDIPVTLYAKDLPLGVLLRGLARATHNIVRTEEANGTITYRICQDPKLARQFADFDKAKVEYRKDLKNLDWDWMLHLKDMPDSELLPLNTWSTSTDPNTGLQVSASRQVVQALQTQAMKKLSQFMSALGPEYRQRVIGGDDIAFTPDGATAEMKASLLSVLSAFDRLELAHTPQNPDHPHTPRPVEELAKETLIISAKDSEYSPLESHSLLATIRTSITTSDSFKATALSGHSLDPYEFESAPYKALGKDRVPAPPEIVEDSVLDLDFPDPLLPPTPPGQNPQFELKIDLNDLADQKGLNYAAGTKELARRARYSFVMEDWDYFKEDPVPPRYLFKGWRLADCLGMFPVRIDHRDKLIVGLDSKWVAKHQNLVPAAVVDTLAKKLNTDGVDLEDILPVLCLREPQYCEWFSESKDLTVLARHVEHVSHPLWLFYAGLSTADRASAASAEGLGLAHFDAGVVADLVQQTLKARRTPGSEDAPNILDDEAMAKLALRLQIEPDSFRPASGEKLAVPRGRAVPRGLDFTYLYSLQLSTVVVGNQRYIADAVGASNLPIYSKEREAQLIKALVGDTTTPSPGGNH